MCEVESWKNLQNGCKYKVGGGPSFGGSGNFYRKIVRPGYMVLLPRLGAFGANSGLAECFLGRNFWGLQKHFIVGSGKLTKMLALCPK
jgi:hypothetical protein